MFVVSIEIFLFRFDKFIDGCGEIDIERGYETGFIVDSTFTKCGRIETKFLMG